MVNLGERDDLGSHDGDPEYLHELRGEVPERGRSLTRIFLQAVGYDRADSIARKRHPVGTWFADSE